LRWASYNLGIKSGVTNQNLAYGLVAETLPFLGRLSAGYYFGNGDLLIDEAGRRSNHGFLASWDRTISELSDKLWLAVDYQGGDNLLGSLNAGLAWAFSDNVSAIAGYDHYFNHAVGGEDTLTFQVDINI